ncbi:MAG: hypothetical protein WC462_05035 [archaeon]
MRKIVIVSVVLLLVLLVFGCTQTNTNGINQSPDPKELLSQLIEKESSLENFYAAFDSNLFKSSNGADGHQSISEVWRKGVNWKYANSSVSNQNGLSISSKYSTFVIGGVTTNCSGIQVNNIQSQTTVQSQASCNLNPVVRSGAIEVIPQNLSLLLDKDFNFNGERTISEKFSCYDFSFDLNMFEYQDLVYSNSSQDTNISDESKESYSETLKNFRTLYEVCLDKSNGFVDFEKISSYITSRPQGTPDNYPIGVYQGMTYSIKDFTTVVSDANFEIPADSSKN